MQIFNFSVFLGEAQLQSGLPMVLGFHDLSISKIL